MTENDSLMQEFEREMLPKIYGFCRLKMNCEAEACDLAQEICLEVLKAVRRGRQIENLGAFVYSVSRHMFYNFLRKKKNGATVFLGDCIPSEDSPEEEMILKEQKNLLRRELSLMAGNYRKAVIMHYFDGLSCEDIAAALGSTAGTVKWWLHEARNALEKGMNTVREYGEKSFRPGDLFVSCTGTPGGNFEPMSCAKRKSAQNILLAAYREPLSVAELSEELGISAPYIEDEVEYLVENELMRQVSRGRYQTDFVILPNWRPGVSVRIYSSVMPEYFVRLMDFLEKKPELFEDHRFNRGGFSRERLLWVYIHIITDGVTGHFRFKDGERAIPYCDIPLRPNGGRWLALGYDKSVPVGDCEEVARYLSYDGPGHKVGDVRAQSFYHYWSGLDSSQFFDIPDGALAVCRDIIKGEKSPDELCEEDKYYFSIALEKELFLKKGCGYVQNFYFADRDTLRELEDIVMEFYPVAEPLVAAAYEIIMEELKGYVPRHLYPQMGNFLTNHLSVFVTGTLHMAMEQGLLSDPDAPGKAWLSLFVTE